MNQQKLESIISGYLITADDAAWLRSLAAPVAGPPEPTEEQWENAMEAFDSVTKLRGFSEWCDKTRAAIKVLYPSLGIATEPEPALKLLRDWFYANADFDMADWHRRTRDFLEDGSDPGKRSRSPTHGAPEPARGEVMAHQQQPGTNEQSAFEKAARQMNETGQGEHGWVKP